jgi:hypothetical protein
MSMTDLTDLEITVDETEEEAQSPTVPNILDNYELINNNYTKGINITQCSLPGGHNFTVWEFSGYEPYQIFYDKFIRDTQCIHLIVYNLNQPQDECLDECLHWLEYLRARISSHVRSSETQGSGTSFINLPPIKIIFIATHADLDKSCVVRKEDGLCTSEKARVVKQMLENYYRDDTVFDLSETHFVLDSRAAWTPNVKNLLDFLVQQKERLCEQLPKSTMILNRTLNHIQLWRKQLQTSSSSGSSSSRSPSNSRSVSTTSTPCSTVPSTPTTPITNASIMLQFGNQTQTPSTTGTAHNSSTSTTVNYPIISWKQFVDQIRESINPLASDEHLNELIAQLHAMGEVIYLEGGFDNDMVCYQPDWLCGTILGRLFSHERYLQIKPANLNGFYSLNELREIYADVCWNMSMLVDIFLSFNLCTELEKLKSHASSELSVSNGGLQLRNELMYEFPAFNFLSEPLPLSFHTIKASHNSPQKNGMNKKPLQPSTCFVFNGFQIRTSHCHLSKNTNTRGRSNSITASHLNLSMKSMAPYSSISSDSSNFLVVPPSQLASLFFKIQVHLRYE